MLALSKALADGLLDALKADTGLLGIFGQAGIIMEEQGDLIKQCRRMARHYLPTNMYDDPQKVAELEAKEDEAFAALDYQTCKSNGAQGPELIKALDFTEHMGPNVRVFNMRTARARPDKSCKARQAGRTRSRKCGLSFPAQLWGQARPTWRFFCRSVG